MVLTCTACASTFDNPDEQREHFRTEWHRYNLKRKVVGLPPISSTNFHSRVVVTQTPTQFNGKCNNCKKVFSTEQSMKQHLESKKHKDSVKKSKNGESIETRKETIETGIPSKANTPLKVNSIALSTIEETNAAVTIGETNCDMEGLSEQQMEEAAREGIPLDLEDCIFCTHRATDLDSCLVHMRKLHGFFIPDREYVEDISKLVAYFGEKVKLGRYCLYCNGKGKTFHTYQDCQKHMISKSHCKIAYSTDDNFEELEDFYDFTSSYNVLKNEMEVEEEQDDDNEWVTDSEDDENDDKEDEDEDEDEDYSPPVQKMLEISETGELILLDGRRCGMRQYRRYYKQRCRPEEDRESIRAVQREKYFLPSATSSSALSKYEAKMKSCMRSSCNGKVSTYFAKGFAEAKSIRESKKIRNRIQKHLGRLDFRSHKLQSFPNRKQMVCV